MNGLSLPTDNLYKFIALAGLVLIIFSAYIDYTKGMEMSLAVEELKGQLEIDKAESQYIEPQISEAAKQNDAPAYRKLIREREKQKAVVDAKLATVKFQSKVYFWLRRVLVTAYIVGAGVSFFGFLLWYIKVQRHLDAAIRLESKIKKSR